MNEVSVTLLAQLSIHKCEYFYVKYYSTNNWKIKEPLQNIHFSN